MSTALQTDENVLRFLLPITAKERQIPPITDKERRELALSDALQAVIDEDGWPAAAELITRTAEGYQAEAKGWNQDVWRARVNALTALLEADKEGLS